MPLLTYVTHMRKVRNKHYACVTPGHFAAIFKVGQLSTCGTFASLISKYFRKCGLPIEKEDNCFLTKVIFSPEILKIQAKVVADDILFYVFWLFLFFFFFFLFFFFKNKSCHFR